MLQNKSYPTAEMMTGTAITNENAAEVVILAPAKSPPTIVAPDRLIPGNKAMH